MDPGSILPRTAGPAEALREALAALEAGHAAAVATVVERRGSAPATPGQKLALVWNARTNEALRAVGTVGGGAIEQAVVRFMLDALADPTSQPKVHTFRLGPSLGMCCGGSADILIEVMRPGCGVLLVGAGHVGLATARLVAELGFSVVLVDARDSAADPARISELVARGVRFIGAEHDDPEVLEALASPTSSSALVVMTHDHALDQRVVEWALTRGFAFVGGVGSRAKAERTRQRLRAKGVAEADVERVKMPVGTAIGARRPLEIAVAIAGDLIEFRARREQLVRGSGGDSIERADAEPPEPAHSRPIDA
ncbi:MAG: XdhC family protein [Polyangiaceae bacterium]|nr:XdhC family protein [Polyangiaceae bacterium]